MPKVISHTPPWLCQPSPGASFFSQQASHSSTVQLDQTIDAYEGPQRTLAKRGTEVFTVVDNQIRWSNLAVLKRKWQSGARSRGGIFKGEIKDQAAALDGSASSDAEGQVSYRVIQQALVCILVVTANKARF
jgi:nucleoporin NUP82